MRIAIRCDWGPGIGLGHLGRCVAIARAAQGCGHDVSLLANSGSGPVPDMARGIPIEVLDLGKDRRWDVSQNPDATTSSFLAYELTDANSTMEFVRRHDVNAVLLDHYFLGNSWTQSVSSTGVKMHVIDDIDRDWDFVDTLIDPRPTNTRDHRKTKNSRTYSGLRYYPASATSARARYEKQQSEQHGNVLVFTGGADGTGLTTRYVEALDTHRGEFGNCRVIVGQNVPNREDVAHQLASIPWLNVGSEVPDIADVYSECDLVLGAGGVSVFERCCVGVPQVVTSVSENQVSQCTELDQLGCLVYTGAVGSIDSGRLSSVIGEILGNANRRANLSEISRCTVDEYGAGRIALLLFGTAELPTFRTAENRDVYILFHWVNEDGVRANAINTSMIDWHEHNTWFTRLMASPGHHLWILELQGVPVGQMRLDIDGETATVSYSVDKDFRGTGLGRHAVELAVDKSHLLGCIALHATVKTTNAASMRIFETAGFTRGDNEHGTFSTFALSLAGSR